MAAFAGAIRAQDSCTTARLTSSNQTKRHRSILLIHDPPRALHRPDPEQRMRFADGLDIAGSDIERRKRSGSTGAPDRRKRRARQH